MRAYLLGGKRTKEKQILKPHRHLSLHTSRLYEARRSAIHALWHACLRFFGAASALLLFFLLFDLWFQCTHSGGLLAPSL
jgi:hypothetical protein